MRRSIHHAISRAPTKSIIALNSVNRFSRDRPGPPAWPGEGKLDMRLQRSPKITRSARRSAQKRAEGETAFRAPSDIAAQTADTRCGIFLHRWPARGQPVTIVSFDPRYNGGRALYLNGTITAWHAGAFRPKAPPKKRHLLVVHSILFCEKRYTEYPPAPSTFRRGQTCRRRDRMIAKA